MTDLKKHLRRTRQAWATGLLVALIALPLAGARGQAADEPIRAWSLESGERVIEASWAGWDAESRKVSLQLPDDSELQISIDDLSDADRRWLAARLRQMRRAKQRDQARAGDTNARDTSQSRIPETGKPADEPTAVVGQRLYGIDWHTTPPSAAVAAQGRESSADDRPIIWFRVLGDLSGFM